MANKLATCVLLIIMMVPFICSISFATEESSKNTLVSTGTDNMGNTKDLTKTINVKCEIGECCNGTCTDTNTDRYNCGRCGNKCTAAEECINKKCCPVEQSCNGTCCLAGQICINGECCDVGQSCTINEVIECCPSGKVCCNGKCVDIHSDLNNCGSCGNACMPEESCCSGQYVDTYFDPNNCGNCGKACQSGESCCNSGCIDTDWDIDNCGECGNACSSGETCIAGECNPTDDTGQGIGGAEDADEET